MALTDLGQRFGAGGVDEHARAPRTRTGRRLLIRGIALVALLAVFATWAMTQHQAGPVAAGYSPRNVAVRAGLTKGELIVSWDMPQLGILHLKTEGGTRFQVQSSSVADDGLVVAQVTPLPPEPALKLPEAFAPLASLLELMIDRIRVHRGSATPGGDVPPEGSRELIVPR